MKILILLMIFVTQLHIMTACAGPITSGGGQSVVCLNENQTINSAQQFDLYEGSILLNWLPLDDQRDYKQQLFDAVLKLNSGRAHDIFFAREFASELETLNSNIRFIENAELKTITDSDSPITPSKPCVVAQVADYDSTGFIFINKKIWDHFSETSKAALMLHEALYSYLRRSGETTSNRARRLVSFIFSGQSFDAMTLPTEYVTCFSNQTQIYLYSLNGWLRIKLDTISGYKIFGDTNIETFPGASIEEALNDIIKKGADTSMGIFPMSPIDFDRGATLGLKINSNNKLNLYGRSVTRSERTNPDIVFDQAYQLSCVPSNSGSTSSTDWMKKFPIQTGINL